MAAIERVNDFDWNEVDIDQLVNDYNNIYSKYQSLFINLKKPANCDDLFGVHYGADTLFDRKTMKYVKYQQEFVQWCQFLNDYPALNALCRAVVAFADQHYQLKVGRIRLLTLKQKTNLRYHIDKESSVRLHVPLITNRRIFFVIDDIVERMPDVGCLYKLDVQKEHTVVNASHLDRVHLVFDLYK